MGKRLRRAREELGLTLDGLREKIRKELREDIGKSTIRDIEADRPPNPGIKTIEIFARGVELAPIEVIALGLDEELESAAAQSAHDFANSDLMRLWKLRAGAKPRERALIDEVVQMLIDRVAEKNG